MNKKKMMATALALAVATLSMAEEAIVDTSKVREIDEVVVVSQPKEQFLLRHQTLSSNVYSGMQLANLGARDLREVAPYVPNFVMPNYGSRYTSSMYVRGIGSRINSPAIGIYVDGAPLMSKSAFNFHNFDIARIDILRGPQGTLYGMNTEGGLIRIYTKSPLNYQGTDLRIGLGTHGYQLYEASTYQKLNSKLAFMVGGFYNGQQGFFKNDFNGERADKYKEAGAKLRLAWKPNQRWDIGLWANYEYTDQNGFPYGMMDLEKGTTANPATNHQSKYRRNIANSALSVNFKGNYFDFNSTTSYQYLKDFMRMDIDYMPADFMHLEQKQLQNAFTQELVLKSNRNNLWHWTLGGTFSAQWLKTDAPVFFDSEMDAFMGNTIRTAMYDAMVKSMSARFQRPGVTAEQAQAQAKAMIERMGGVKMETDLSIVPGLFRTPTYNLGFFHESSFQLTERLKAILGLRYDYSHTSLDYITSAQMTSVATVMGKKATVTLKSLLQNKAHNDFNQLLPKIGLSYDLDRSGSNVYAVVSKGYRAGGYNIQMFSDILSTELRNNSSQRGDYTIDHDEEAYSKIEKTIAYNPETSWNYELGAHLNLFDNKIQFDFAAFYMQLRNQQLSVMAGNYGFGRMMVNAGKSSSCGIEATLRGNALNDNLSWGASYGFTRAVFKEYTDEITINGTTQNVDYKDKKVPFIPAHTLAAHADYRIPFNGTLKAITIGANMNAQGQLFWDEANSYSQDFYAVMGAHVKADLGFLSIDLWG
ncbi:TonB-dependent receptor, partial [Prevotella sp.]|uniref:TonB-dependent receptor n=1 Tax=Prevotella sp. TaxID=59823 RepID=UPI002F91D06A